MSRRLFVAVALDEATRAACAAVAEHLRGEGWHARWVQPENYHLTVAFLGGVDADRVDDVAAAVRDVAAGVPSFEVPLDAVGAFPHERRPRVAWTGPAHAVRAFGTACGVVRSSLVARGFTFDDRADAHVTLARADGFAPLPSVAPPRDAVVMAEAMTLYESFTERGGARYVALERFPLAAATPG
ncbi:MAG TPA: RNA 2',3'-cyclic phosphodiesterase [Candidatus Elarobacter sp.]|nr:RNA 2',3'-cyclic phosphodiesterase [Candidatus Elarobacter sp.]